MLLLLLLLPSPAAPDTSCKNMIPDSDCQIIASRNYCVSNEFKGNCPRSCNSCNYRDPSTSGNNITTEEKLNIDIKDFNLTGYKEIP